MPFIHTPKKIYETFIWAVILDFYESVAVCRALI